MINYPFPFSPIHLWPNNVFLLSDLISPFKKPYSGETEFPLYNFFSHYEGKFFCLPNDACLCLYKQTCHSFALTLKVKNCCGC